jgi:crotonobetainyl-CoA:carnitine CoA-transferase CaiB-like acyl-CoA transferase
MVRTVPHERREDFRTLANPIKLDGERPPSRAAPSLGADTDTLLAELGFSTEQIAALRRSKVV